MVLSFLGSALPVLAARKALEHLHRTHGALALAAAAEDPGVSAALDQHAAAVRDILEFGIEDAHLVPAGVLLAGYADGLMTHAREAAAELGPPADWRAADWIQLRLAAVCFLAHSA